MKRFKGHLRKPRSWIKKFLSNKKSWSLTEQTSWTITKQSANWLFVCFDKKAIFNISSFNRVEDDNYVNKDIGRMLEAHSNFVWVKEYNKMCFISHSCSRSSWYIVDMYIWVDTDLGKCTFTIPMLFSLSKWKNDSNYLHWLQGYLI